MASKIEAARQLVYAAARACDTGAANVSRLSAMSKFFATEVAMEVTTHAVQLFGGYGYMRDYPIEKYMRDAKITQIYEGTNEVQRLVIARNIQRDVQDLSALLDPYIPKESQFVAEGEWRSEEDVERYSVPAVN
jgi:butyryl-CoA dehydrogenase